MACGEKPSNELSVITNYNFEDGKTEDWQPNFTDSWEVTDLNGTKVYALTEQGESGEVAAPKSWSVIAGHDMTSFEFSGRLKCLAEIDTTFTFRQAAMKGTTSSAWSTAPTASKSMSNLQVRLSSV